jgi:ankyrin repeat protein
MIMDDVFFSLRVAFSDHLQVCKLLINAGADVTAKNQDGATCLHYLARISAPENPKQFVELLKLVLRKGAQVNKRREENRKRAVE